MHYSTLSSPIKIAEHPNELDFAANDIAVVAVDGKKICVGRRQDKFFAIAYTCPHAGACLADASMDAQGSIVCPLHRYRFNPHTGINVSGEGYYLRHWKVEWNEEGVFVLFT